MNKTTGYKKPISWRVYSSIIIFMLILIGYSAYHFYYYHFQKIEIIFFSAYLLLNTYLVFIFRKYNRARLNDIAALEEITRTLADEINERNRIEDALRESELRYRNICENTDNAIAVYEAVNNGEDFVFKEFNKSAERIEQVKREDVIGRQVTQIFPGIIEFGMLDVFKQVWITGKPERVPSKFYSDNRISGWRNNYIYKLPNSEIVAVYSDETQRMLAQEERENLIKELEMKNTEMEQFTYMVSHDLKSPLITIKGFAGLLEKDLKKNATDNVIKDVEKINNAAEKMQVLLDELLELSRIGRLVNSPVKVSFRKLVDEALDSVAGQLEETDVKIVISENLPEVYVDGSRVREMLMNLFDNAIKFTDKDNPIIEIGSRKIKNEHIFYVRDNGPGINPAYHEKIFGLFDKLNPDTDGSGAGLAIVKRIVEVHKGRIWVESDGSGKGSTFFFNLPVKKTGDSDVKSWKDEF